MTAYAVFQAVVIAALLVWSAWFAAKRLLPRSYRGVQAALARRLAMSSSRLLRKFGLRITPQQVATGAGCGSGGGCSSCGTCAPAAALPNDLRPLVFEPRAKH